MGGAAGRHVVVSLSFKLAVAGRSLVMVSAFVLFFFSDELNVWSPWTLALGDFKVSVGFFFFFFFLLAAIDIYCFLSSLIKGFRLWSYLSNRSSILCNQPDLLHRLLEIPPAFRKRTSENASMCSFYSLHVEALIAPLFVVWHDRISHWFLF